MLAASIFLPSSHRVDREEMEWQQGRGSEESGSEGDGEKKHVEWEWGDRQEEQKERTERERGRRLSELWPRNYEHSLGQMLHKQPEDLSIPLR